MFRERGREGEKHQCVAASHTPPTGNLACNPGMCPDWELTGWPCGSQASAESTEPHQPGPGFMFAGIGKPLRTESTLTICVCVCVCVCVCMCV